MAEAAPIRQETERLEEPQQMSAQSSGRHVGMIVGRVQGSESLRTWPGEKKNKTARCAPEQIERPRYTGPTVPAVAEVNCHMRVLAQRTRRTDAVRQGRLGVRLGSVTG